MATRGVLKVGDSAKSVDHVFNLVNSGYKVYINYGNYSRSVNKDNIKREQGNVFQSVWMKCYHTTFDQTTVVTDDCYIIGINANTGYSDGRQIMSWYMTISWYMDNPFKNLSDKKRKAELEVEQAQNDMNLYYECVWEIIGPLIAEFQLVLLIFEYVC